MRGRRRAFSLIELLIVMALMSIVAAAVLPSFTPSIVDRLQSTAQIIAADVAYTRDLALSGDSTYELDFDTEENRYTLEHTGTNSLLDTLPTSPLGKTGGSATRQITDLDELPHLGPTVQLVAVHKSDASPVAVTDVEFGPLGGTTRSEPTLIWLGAGAGSSRRYLSVRVNPITGLTTIGQVQSSPPQAGNVPPL